MKLSPSGYSPPEKAYELARLRLQISIVRYGSHLRGVRVVLLLVAGVEFDDEPQEPAQRTHVSDEDKITPR